MTLISIRIGELSEMTSLQFLMNSTRARGTSSGGLPVISYARPSGQSEFSTGLSLGEAYPLNFSAIVTHTGGRTTFGYEGSFDDNSLKRIAACILALKMPEAGVDENLQSTLDRLNYYQELSSFPAIQEKAGLTKISGSLSQIRNRPGLVLSDS